MKLAGLLPGADRPFTGLHMLALAGLFFGTVITVNVGMAVASIRTWTGLTVENSYVASQQFDDHLNALRHQQSLGWAPDLAFDGASARLTLRDAAGAPVALRTVVLTVNRPVGAADDQTLALEQGRDGVYAAPLSLAPGVWDIAATAESDEGPFLIHRRIRVEPPK